eukprot:PhM_4_TR10872/c0_g1_i1/m.15997
MLTRTGLCLKRMEEGGCEWYNYHHLHPSKRYLYWAHRHLRKVPNEWRPYYRALLRQEVLAYRFLNTNWEQFRAVVEGYRKAKWVLRKYGQEPESDSIPHPYDDFYTNTTMEERAYAYRRSYDLKDIQAFQREDEAQNVAYSAVPLNRSDVTHNMVDGTVGRGPRDVRGSPVHAVDMPAPKESDVRQDAGGWSEVISDIQLTMETNPMMRLKEYSDDAKQELEEIGFEDDEDDTSFGEDTQVSAETRLRVERTKRGCVNEDDNRE